MEDSTDVVACRRIIRRVPLKVLVEQAAKEQAQRESVVFNSSI